MACDSSGVAAAVAAAQTVFLVTKEVDLGTYQETLLEMQDVVQVRRSRFVYLFGACFPCVLPRDT